MKRTRLGWNMLLYAIKSSMGVLFPLITYPYISKVLGVEQLGHNDFAKSIISYFVMFAGLGIFTYAVREGAKVRNDSKASTKLFSELYSINCLSTAISYAMLFMTIGIVAKLWEYKWLLLIYSVQIFLTTVGKEWILSAHEEFLYVTIRSIFFQLLSLILMFTLVKDESDITLYAVISLISASGSQIMNVFYVRRKYPKIRFGLDFVSFKRHIKPIMMIFGMTATVAIYVSSDVTILGFMTNDYRVGLYSLSAKIYSIIKTLLSSVLVVSIPRLSTLVGGGKKEEEARVSSEVYNTLLTFLIPIIVGIVLESEDIVYSISSKDFGEASSSLVILGIALFFCMGAWFWGQCVLIPHEREDAVLRITLISAVINIVLNILLIPLYQENAAALTTVVAEAMSFFYCRHIGKKYVQLNNVIETTIKCLVGSLPVVFFSIWLDNNSLNPIYRLISVMALSLVFYILIELLLKNQIATNIVSHAWAKWHSVRNK